jgi:hypothetical protein
MGPSFQRGRSCDRHLLITRDLSPFLTPLSPSRRFGDPTLREVAREQQRMVFADDAVDRVRGVKPEHADADHRIVNGAELVDGPCGFERNPSTR